MTQIKKQQPIKSFVLRSSRLVGYQEQALKRYSERYVIPFEKKLLDFPRIFGNEHPVIIEIGFGKGEATEQIAKNTPYANFLGIEVFLKGFATLLSHVAKDGVENIKLIRHDAAEVLMHMVADESVAGFHLFFPDPWPKKRHHKRRLVQQEFAAMLVRRLISGGYIYCVTDWQEYAQQMLDVFSSLDTLTNPYGGFARRRLWRPMTKFEEKERQSGCEIYEIWVEKRPPQLR